MKFLAVAFSTATMVYAVAMLASFLTPVSEQEPSFSNASHRNERVTGTSTSRRKTLSQKSTANALPNSEKALAGASELDRQKSDLVKAQLAAIRQQESEIKARDESMRIIIEEIRDEQANVAEIRQQVSEQIAALTDVTNQVNQLKMARGSTPNREARRTAPLNTTSTGSRQPLTLSSQQAVRDTAILVRRFSELGDIRAATGLLAKLKDRDAAKVLTALQSADPELAERLTDSLTAEREGSTVRR